MKNLLIIFLVLITNTLFCQIKPSQIRKGGSTVVEVLVSDTLNGGTLSYKPLGNEVYRYMSPYIDNYWAKSGNNITSSDRLGTLNNQDLIFIRGGVEKGRVDGIGIVAGYNTSYNSQNYVYLPSLTVVPQQNENGAETHLLGITESALHLEVSNSSYFRINKTFDLTTLNSNHPIHQSNTQFYDNLNNNQPLKINNLATSTSDSILTISNSVVKKTAYINTDSFFRYNGNSVNSNYTFGTKTNYSLPFITNNIERMRITQNGNIGIGTNAPTYTLDVIAEQNTASANGLRVVSATGNALVVQGGGISNPIAVFNNTSGTEKMRLSSTGNLGIGITNPSYRLDVSAASDPLRLQGLQAGTTTDSILTSNSGVVRRLAINQLGNTIVSTTSASPNFSVTNENIVIASSDNTNGTITLSDAIGKNGHRVTITRGINCTATITITSLASNQITSLNRTLVNSTTLEAIGSYGQSLQFISNGTYWFLLN